MKTSLVTAGFLSAGFLSAGFLGAAFLAGCAVRPYARPTVETPPTYKEEPLHNRSRRRVSGSLRSPLIKHPGENGGKFSAILN